MSVVVTGIGAICGAGASPSAIVDAALAARSAIAEVASFDATGWPRRHAAEVTDYNAAKLVGDRKLLKLIRRSDVFGIYAADAAIAQAGLEAHRQALDEAAQVAFAEATGCYVGSGGGAFNVNYDYFPLMAESKGDMGAFGRELGSSVNPMWLLRTLPNNVLCHVGIRHGLKGPNGCITNHTTSGLLAVIEGAEAIREGEAERIVSAGHDAPWSSRARASSATTPARKAVTSGAGSHSARSSSMKSGAPISRAPGVSLRGMIASAMALIVARSSAARMRGRAARRVSASAVQSASGSAAGTAATAATRRRSRRLRGIPELGQGVSLRAEAVPLGALPPEGVARLELWGGDDYASFTTAGWSSLVARRAHNPKVAGSNPAPATRRIRGTLSGGCLVVSGSWRRGTGAVIFRCSRKWLGSSAG